MGVQKKTRKFATVKRVIGQRDARLKKNILKNEGEPQKKEEEQLVRNVQVSQGKIAGSSWLMVSSEQSTSANTADRVPNGAIAGERERLRLFG